MKPKRKKPNPKRMTIREESRALTAKLRSMGEVKRRLVNKNDLKKKRGEPDEPMHIWIGARMEVLHHMKEQERNGKRDRIITEGYQLRGLKGPMLIHLCGNYKELDGWWSGSFTIGDISSEIQFLKLKYGKDQVKFERHN